MALFDPLLGSGITAEVCRAAVQEAGTPLFLYSADRMRQQFSRVRSLLGADFTVLYSIKANPSLAVAGLFQQLGAGAEVSSGGELEIACRAGFDREWILFCGPGKTGEEIELAVSRRVLISVESELEPDLILAACRRTGVMARAAVRINPGVTASDARLQMAGITQFGLDGPACERVLAAIKNHSLISWQGFHCYMGTQILDAEQITANAELALAMMEDLARRSGLDIAVADIGGGFGVPYYPTDSEFDLERACAGVGQMIPSWRALAPFAHTRFAVELGRYLVAAAGLYVTRVVDVKHNAHRTFVVTDGGINHFMPAGAIGRVVRRNLPLGIVPPCREGDGMTADVVGPMCTPLDMLGRNVDLPAVQPGDLVAIPNAGAYGLSASPHSWLSHRVPAEMIVDGGRLYAARRRGTFSDAISGQETVTYDEQGVDSDV